MHFNQKEKIFWKSKEFSPHKSLRCTEKVPFESVDFIMYVLQCTDIKINLQYIHVLTSCAGNVYCTVILLQFFITKIQVFQPYTPFWNIPLLKNIKRKILKLESARKIAHSNNTFDLLCVKYEVHQVHTLRKIGPTIYQFWNIFV